MSLIRTAKKTGIPYTVNELSNSEFLDFKQLCPQVGKNFHKTTEGLDLKMTEFKVLKVEKDKPDSFIVKTSFREEEPFHTIKLFPTRKKRKSAELLLLANQLLNTQKIFHSCMVQNCKLRTGRKKMSSSC